MYDIRYYIENKLIESKLISLFGLKGKWGKQKTKKKINW